VVGDVTFRSGGVYGPAPQKMIERKVTTKPMRIARKDSSKIKEDEANRRAEFRRKLDSVFNNKN